jgi:hypothetical protein
VTWRARPVPPGGGSVVGESAQTDAGAGLGVPRGLRRSTRIRPPRAGVKVTARRVTRSARPLAAASWARARIVESTTFISNWAKLAPRQLLIPPPERDPLVGARRALEEPLGPEPLRLGIQIRPAVEEVDGRRDVHAGRDRPAAELHRLR